MTRDERIAIARVFADLIKADSIIDGGEMASYAALKGAYNILREDESAAEQMTFSNAVSILKKLDGKQREKVVADYISMSVSDGFCARSEALLILTLYCCLQSVHSAYSDVISFPAKDSIVSDNQLLYIESDYDERINAQIQAEYRSIVKELNLNALDLVYIPKVIDHYRETPVDLLKNVFMFLMPSLTDSRVEEVIDTVLSIDTGVFVKDILCNKYGVKEFRQVAPSFLLKIGNDIVGGIKYSNFLRVSLADCDVLQMARELMDYFSGLQNTDVLVFSQNNDSEGKFFYKGFYRQLIDLYTQKSNLSSRIVVNPYKETITLVDIDMVLTGLHRKEKALYTLFLLESPSGGIDFTPPKSAAELDEYNVRMKLIQEKYSVIYELFGGDRLSAPQLEQPEIRRPMLSCIKKSISQVSGYLHSIDDYQIERNKDGAYRLHVDKELIMCDAGNRRRESIFESEVFNAYFEIDNRVATL